MKRILNVACGKDTYGTDFVDMYPSRKEVIQCDIEKGLPFEDGVFDEVYSHCLFEHLRNPFNMLLEMKRVTKVGGRVRVITDNGSYWVFALNHSAHTGGYEKPECPDDQHYCFFTKTHLIHHYTKAGLAIEDVKFVEYFSSSRLKTTVCVIVQSLLKLTPFRNMAYGRIDITGINQPKNAGAVFRDSAIFPPEFAG
jgi:SAM-dependent methyltransferase